jgi:hypothetical protein
MTARSSPGSPPPAVGDVAAGQSVDPLSINTDQLLAPTHPTANQASKKPSAIGGSPPVGLRPTYGPPPMALSHPDCRCPLSLIVGGHDRLRVGGAAAPTPTDTQTA